MKYLLKFDVSNIELTQESVNLFTDRCFGYKVHISFSKKEQVLPVRTQILKENDFLALLQWQEKF